MSLDDVPPRQRLSDGSLIVMADKDDVALIRFRGAVIELGTGNQLYFTSRENPTAYALLVRGPGGFQRVDLGRGTWILRRLDDDEAARVEHSADRIGELIGDVR